MNIAERLIAMARMYERRPLVRFSDPARSSGKACTAPSPARPAQVRRGSNPRSSTPRSGHDHAHARRNDLEVAVVTPAVLRRRLADDLGETRAERAERR